MTKPQKSILTFLTTYLARHGYPPTRTEIAEKMGFASANAAQGHLESLARKGYIELSPGVGRGIKILSKGNGK